MTRLVLVLLSLLALFALAGCGGGNDRQLDSADTYICGAPVTIEKSTALAELTGSPEKFVGQTLRLEGKVTGVCKGSGCWIELDDGLGHRFIAKSLDHSVRFPTDCDGRRAVVQGVILTQPATGHAEPDSHVHAEGEADHVCPAPLYMMDLKGGELL